jgi:hypothetical protein
MFVGGLCNRPKQEVAAARCSLSMPPSLRGLATRISDVFVQKLPSEKGSSAVKLNDPCA